ncbi:MAG: hypothetical protein AAFX40_13505, partial [Cyanobacteria bacterium J06639_1]
TKETVVADLGLIDYQVTDSEPCGEIILRLREEKELCGAIIVDDSGNLRGMLSRNFVLEWLLGQRYGIDAFRKKPISAVLDFNQRPTLCIPASLQVLKAVEQSFQRPKEYVDDPVAIAMEDGSYRMVDMRMLLMA